MHPVFWKGLSAVLILCLIAQQYSLHGGFSLSSVQTFEQQEPSDHTGWKAPVAFGADAINKTDRPDTLEPEQFDWTRDANNFGFSDAQCDAAFPELWNEIDRAKEYWQDKEIRAGDLDLFEGNDGGVRVLIKDSQLRIISSRGLGRSDFRHRIIAVLQQILRAITAAEYANQPVPNGEFTIIVDDKPVQPPKAVKPYFAFTRAYSNEQHDALWVIPDFHFFGAPPEAQGFAQMRENARKHDAPLVDKIPQVVWRGAEWTNPEVRSALVKASTDKEWADVQTIDWKDRSTIIPMDAFCKYRYVVNTEGRSWSARMTHLLNCNSLLFVHDVEWIAHYYHLMETSVNCIRVERNFTDLEEKVTYFNDHISEAQEIADNARTTFRERYTTPAATACYWRKLLRAWASVSFAPETTVAMNNRESEQVTRGISFEEFIVHENTIDYPYSPLAKPGNR